MQMKGWAVEGCAPLLNTPPGNASVQGEPSSLSSAIEGGKSSQSSACIRSRKLLPWTTVASNAVREGHIWRVTGKTGQEVSLPVHPRLEAIIASAAPHDAITLAASSKGTPWTSDGFRSSFNKAMRRLEDDGKVGPDLTFHGLRHAVGTLMIESGVELDIVRRWLGQKTLAMAIHYSEGANTAEQMSGAVLKFDPLGGKKETSNV
jgi:hypothetical protein